MREMTSAEFHADPGAAYRAAARCACVIVLDLAGKPRLVISRQRRALR